MRVSLPHTRRAQLRTVGAIAAALSLSGALLIACGHPATGPSAVGIGASTAPTTTESASPPPMLGITPSTIPPTSTTPGGEGGSGGTGEGGEGGEGGSGGGGGGNPPSYTLGSAVISRTTFGMHVGQLTSAAWPSIPMGSFRIWNTDSTWGALEPSPGQWNFTRLDARVEAARARGATIVLVLGMTPAWAATNPDQVGFGGSPSPPRDMNQWANYVRTVATRYAGKIEAYEIWNEANLPQFYSGTAPQLGEMTRIASQQIRSVSSAKVVSSGLSARTPGAQIFFHGLVASGIGSAIDIVGIHIYPFPGYGPESMVGLTQTFRRISNANGLSSKPMWNTEIGYGRTPRNIVPDSAAPGLILRTYLVLPAAGLPRNYWYMWDDRAFIGLYLVGADRRSPLPAAYHFADAEKLLVGATVKGCHNAGVVWSCDVSLPGGQLVRAAWTTTGTASVPVPATARLAYTFGAGKASVNGGSYTVSTTPVIFAATTIPAL